MLLIDKLSGKPVYEQVIEGIEKNILLGVYAPGSVLPSLRELSVTLGVNPNTVQKSYAELIRRGVIIPSPGSGTYVAQDAVTRIRAAAENRLAKLEELLSDLALAGVPKGDVLAMVYAVYSAAERNGAPVPPPSKSSPASGDTASTKGGTHS